MIAEAEPSNNADESPPAPVLSDKHQHELEHESSISRPVIRARGYRTVSPAEVPAAFKGYQRRAGLLIPTYAIDGRTGHRLKPKTPRIGKDGKPRRYDQPGGVGLFVDVNPINHDAARDPSRPIWFTEGEKKADALTSCGEVAGCLFGVWGWIKPKVRPHQLLDDFDHFALDGRRVNLAFDADWSTNPNVQRALSLFATLLQARGADVWVLYLPIDGPKGVDDKLTAGATVAELRMLTRRFDPADFARVRLSQDAAIRAAIREQQAQLDAMPAKSRANNTDRAIKRALIGRGAASGKLVRGGLRVQADRRTLAELANVSLRAVTRSIPRMEANGELTRDVDHRKPESAGAFILPLTPKYPARYCPQKGEIGAVEKALTTGSAQRKTLTYKGYDPGVDTSARPAPNVETVPELRWPTFRLAREQDEYGRAVEVRDYIARLGKKRGEIVAYLVQHGGTATVAELAERFAGAKTRPRDFQRRTLAMLAEGPVIVTIEDNRVTLAEDWRTALDDARMLTGEIDGPFGEGDDTRQKKRHALQRAAWRYARHAAPPDHAPTEAEMDAARKEREQGPDGYVEDLRPLSPLAVALDGYLRLNPHKVTEYPGWIASTLRVYDWIPEGVTGREIKAAIEELGGNEYRRSIMELARTPEEPTARRVIPLRRPAPAPAPDPTLAPEPVPAPVPAPTPAWWDHPVACSCEDCDTPAPRYARPVVRPGTPEHTPKDHKLDPVEDVSDASSEPVEHQDNTAVQVGPWQ